MRTLLAATALSLVAGLALAQAQAPKTPPAASTQVNPPNPAAPPTPATAAQSATQGATTPPATDTTATASPYRTGATVKDGQGQVVGTIARVIKTPDGATTVSVNVDGRNVNVPASNLTPSADGGAVSSMSKAQITESTKPPA